MFSAIVDRFSEFFQQLVRRNIIYVYTTKISTHLQYVAILPCEIGKSSKMLPNFQVAIVETISHHVVPRQLTTLS